MIEQSKDKRNCRGRRRTGKCSGARRIERKRRKRNLLEASRIYHAGPALRLLWAYLRGFIFFSAVFISSWQMIWYPSLAIPLGSYTLVSGLLVGLIELPICFACCGPCNKLAGYMRVVMGYWVVRGVLYAGA